MCDNDACYTQLHRFTRGSRMNDLAQAAEHCRRSAGAGSRDAKQKIGMENIAAEARAQGKRHQAWQELYYRAADMQAYGRKGRLALWQ